MLLLNHLYSMHLRVWWLLGTMLLALVLSFQFTPDNKMSQARASINFSTILPERFADWEIDLSMTNQLVDPEVKATLESVYSQTVARTYINSIGQRVMLSVAYGGDQDEVMQVHKPEVCYTAQGFSVNKKGTTEIQTNKGLIQAKLLLAKQAERIEPVTYWITIGKSIALDGLQWRWERIKYGLTGELPDGLLFRVSSLGSDTQMQYKLHRMFISDLFANLSSEQAKQFIGKLAID